MCLVCCRPFAGSVRTASLQGRNRRKIETQRHGLLEHVGVPGHEPSREQSLEDHRGPGKFRVGSLDGRGG